MLYRLSYFRNSRFFLVISSLDFASSVGHYQEVTPSILTRPPRNPSKTNFDFVRGKFHFSKQKPDRFGAGFLWEKMDSNHRRYKPADLQSAPFGHSGILPKFLRTFEPMEGIEPTTPRLQITCSGQLSYIGIVVFPRLERVSLDLGLQR